jgi:hypothetical protein
VVSPDISSIHLETEGVIEQVSRGIYRLVDLPPNSDPNLVTSELRGHIAYYGVTDNSQGINRFTYEVR